jgi:hypothetical protein
LCCAPRLAIPEHGVEDDQGLVHRGGEGQLLGLAGDQSISLIRWRKRACAARLIDRKGLAVFDQLGDHLPDVPERLGARRGQVVAP